MEIRPRAVSFAFDDVPRHWFGGVAVASHLVNGLGMLFPAGERFFVRSVHRYKDVVAADPVLREQVRGFAGQEGRHAQAHERYFEALERQGYEIRGFLAAYERIAYGIIEPLAPPELRLATTVALEHFTAIMADRALREGLLERAHPEMQRLLRWHAAEEVEHKSVAFDVLRRVTRSHAWRMAGLGMATACLVSFWVAATATLLVQDSRRGHRRMWAAWRAAPRPPLLREVFLRGIRDYMRRDFHPDDRSEDRALADAWLAGAGLT